MAWGSRCAELSLASAPLNALRSFFFARCIRFFYGFSARLCVLAIEPFLVCSFLLFSFSFALSLSLFMFFAL